jgi:hypothetical protein
MKVVSLSRLRTACLYPPGKISGSHFYLTPIQPHGHSEVGRIMTMKNSSDTIRNRTLEIQAFSTVPQPNIPLCAQLIKHLGLFRTLYIDSYVSTVLLQLLRLRTYN